MPTPNGDFAKTVVATELTREMHDSFVAYAMSVITSRALPDVRDGLKPVQRRILYAMHQMGARPGTPTRKSARVVGEVMGRYHPHGDAAIYDTLVRLGQDFARNVVLVDPQGNFGSLDDPPAAARYTECRLSVAAMALVGEIGEDAVDFRATYDGEGREPGVLPAVIPNLLVNGAGGIAVGMATSIAPHNLVEVAAAIDVALKRGARCTTADLLAVCPGPDFPSGGVVVADDLERIYRDGRGALRMRAVARVVPVDARRDAIEVTELPYQVGPERVVTRVKELVAAEKLPGVTGVKNLSDRHRGLCLQIELRAGADPGAVLSELYRATPLEETFSVNHVALVGGRPSTLGLVEMCQAYIDHRLTVITRRSTYRRDRATERLHLVNGLLVALDRIDKVVKTIRAASDTAAARDALMRLLKLDATQVDHILEMPLRRLTALEGDKLAAEAADLARRIDDLDALLSDEARRRRLVSSELREAAAAYGRPRRTRIVGAGELADTPALTGSRTGNLHLDGGQGGEAGSLVLSSGRVVCGGSGDVVLEADRAVAVTAGGRVLDVVADGRRVTVERLGDDPADQRVVGLVDHGTDLVLATECGVVKRITVDTIARMRSRREVITLRAGDAVVDAVGAQPGDLLAVVTASGQVLHTAVENIPTQGATAGGVAGIRLGDGDRVVGLVAHADAVAVWTDQGRVKVTRLDDIPTKGRATGGVRLARLAAGEAIARVAGVAEAGAPVPVTRRDSAPQAVPVTAAGKSPRSTGGKGPSAPQALPRKKPQTTSRKPAGKAGGR